ncbi:MAG: rod-binding protein [Hydrogenophaga sp.]|uniref:rod-binding protein n=1 Tax=Hydrogenophaga sp. TaxID=1904254 RepID=UPI0025BFD0B6|nr:rod-binding protein [Hydrogenophaga sp.]MBU7572433.1 rod-binding protein [Hydrogenophaga sp.]
MQAIGPSASGAGQPADIDPVLRAKAVDAAEKFEAFFISQNLKAMRRSTQALASEDSPFNNKINQDMLDLADNVVADTMARQRAFGIADVILRQLLPAPAVLKQTPAAVALHEKTPTVRGAATPLEP